MIIPVASTFDEYVEGMQLSLNLGIYDQVKILPNVINIEDFNYHLVDGKLNISWHHTDGIKIKKGDELFRILLTNGSGNQNSFTIGNLIKPELYSKDGDVRKIAVRTADNNERKFELLGNTPNPWNQETSIKFYLPASGDVMLKVKDITGKVVYSLKENLSKGEHSIILTDEKVNSSGILLYEMMFGKEVRTMKMINIK
jgi:hypothetical protein